MEGLCGAGPVSLATGFVFSVPAQACSQKMRFIFKERFQSYGIPSLVSQRRFTEDEDDNIKKLNQFIQELKPLNKALMIMYLDNKTHQEIAAVLGISETNVGTKINRIKKELKKKFKK